MKPLGNFWAIGGFLGQCNYLRLSFTIPSIVFRWGNVLGRTKKLQVKSANCLGYAFYGDQIFVSGLLAEWEVLLNGRIKVVSFFDILKTPWNQPFIKHISWISNMPPKVLHETARKTYILNLTKRRSGVYFLQHCSLSCLGGKAGNKQPQRETQHYYATIC